jgi:hypothetical protein
VAAYYVVSEALTNTTKHAHPSHVQVTVEQRNGLLHLSVRDDGVGGADPAASSGLTGMRDRCRRWAGRSRSPAAAEKGRRSSPSFRCGRTERSTRRYEAFHVAVAGETPAYGGLGTDPVQDPQVRCPAGAALLGIADHVAVRVPVRPPGARSIGRLARGTGHYYSVSCGVVVRPRLSPVRTARPPHIS